MNENPNRPENQPGGPLTPSPQPTSNRAGDTIDEVTTTIRDFVNKVPDTINKAIERALNVRDTTVLLRLSDASSDAVDTLVSAGVFKTRAEATAFLVDEGIKAQAALFQRIQNKLGEIERLRAELRESIAEKG
jgi:hypothetical protein